MKKTIVASLILIPLLVSDLSSQDLPLPFGRANAVSVDPILLPMGSAHVQYERAIGTTSFTVGVGAWLEYRDIHDGWLHLQIMHYTDSPFSGLAFGLSAGVHRSYGNDPGEMTYDTAPVLGGIVDYNWSLGNEGQFLLSVGFGMEAILADRAGNSPLKKTNSNVRLLAGWAF